MHILGGVQICITRNMHIIRGVRVCIIGHMNITIIRIPHCSMHNSQYAYCTRHSSMHNSQYAYCTRRLCMQNWPYEYHYYCGSLIAACVTLDMHIVRGVLTCITRNMHVVRGGRYRLNAVLFPSKPFG